MDIKKVTDETEACPHCGGKSGYQYKMIVRGTQTKGWRGGVDFFEDEGGSHGVERCADCGKRVEVI